MDKALLASLCAIRSISGREDEAREFVRGQIAPFCETSVDPLGNLIAVRRGKQRAATRVMLCAHLDEVGMIVTSVTDGGYLLFETVDGISSRVLAGIPVEVGAQAAPGVIGVKPVHLCAKEEAGREIPPETLRIDIGARSREEAEQVVQPGDMVTFCAGFDADGAVVRGRALDDRAGCALLIELLREEPEYDLTAVFTVQEEVGLRGARAAAFTVAPDAALVCETTTAGDLAGVPEDKQVCRVGGGAVVSFMDRSTVYDRGLYSLALDTAAENGIPVQPKRAVAGGNDAGAVHRARGGVRTAAISLPCRYLHAPVGMIAKADYDAALRLTAALARRLARGEG